MKHVCLGLVKLARRRVETASVRPGWGAAGVVLAGAAMLVAPPAGALPGQLTEEVEAWIQAHPTLQPSSGERLLVRKSNSAAQRFTFQASVFPPGRIAPTADKGRIRTETLSFLMLPMG